MKPPFAETIESIIDAIESANYCDSSKQAYRKELENISKELSIIDSSTEEKIKQIRAGTGLRKRCLLFIQATIENGYVDLAQNVERNKIEVESKAFQQTLTDYLGYLKECGHADSSIRVEGCLARKFLAFLEANECHALDDVSPELIISFVAHLRVSWQSTSIGSALSVFRPFVRFIARDDLIYAAESIKAPRKRAILQVLAHEEIDAVCQAVCEDGVSLRDRAIVLLALKTGIRACDIVSLTIDDIDWEFDCISIIQSKTGNPLMLPLIPIIGNALFDYMAAERPDSPCRNVFLRSRAPYCELKNSSAVYLIIKKALAAAGIKTDGRQCGTRMARHSVASAMLAKGAKFSTIAAVLGHAAQQSTDTYISTDAKRLMLCTLPIIRGEAL